MSHVSDEVRGFLADASKLFLEQLEWDENAAAESVVVNHYTIAALSTSANPAC